MSSVYSSLYHFAKEAPVDGLVIRVSPHVSPQKQSREEARAVVDLHAPPAASVVAAALAHQDEDDQEHEVPHSWSVRRICAYSDYDRPSDLLVGWEVQAD